MTSVTWTNQNNHLSYLGVDVSQSICLMVPDRISNLVQNTKLKLSEIVYALDFSDFL